jgi:hypothetical protein
MTSVSVTNYTGLLGGGLSGAPTADGEHNKTGQTQNQNYNHNHNHNDNRQPQNLKEVKLASP